MKTKSSKPGEKMPQAKADRRLLPHVPDPDRIRQNSDRRGSAAAEADSSLFSRFPGRRYFADFDVRVAFGGKGRLHADGKCVDISQTGILLRLKGTGVGQSSIGKLCMLSFTIPDGTMLEGMEKRIKIQGSLVRLEEDGTLAAFVFVEPIFRYLKHRKDRAAFVTASIFIAFVCAFIIMLRAESVIYFRFNIGLYLYSILTALFLLSRYFFGAMYKPVPINPGFEPGVTIIIPCFNEEAWIRRTILSCVDQEYPVDKLEVIIVDDCSTDNSRQVICDTLEELYREHERFHLRERVKFVSQSKNAGKREAMARGVALSSKELVAFVDSDSFLEPDAVINIVQPLQDEAVAGVSGRTDVANTYTNGLTKMQAVRYYLSFRIMKAAEAFFDSVMCLSGPLSCYRKTVVQENMEKWLNQRFLGMKATFGDDRGMTNLVVKKHQTYYQDTAICSTIVPSSHKTFLRQQMRWKRSWLRESMIAAKFMWKKEPFMALSFYTGLIVPAVAPVVVIYNLIYVPIAHRIFPITFLTGMLLMALLMSFAQLLLRKSKLWLYGLWFCIYYEAILLWQMPWAWLTFWVSTWGTRMTPSDEAAQKRKEKKARSGVAGHE